jgi:hypothetical protein
VDAKCDWCVEIINVHLVWNVMQTAGLTAPPSLTTSAQNGVQLYFEGTSRMIFDGPFKQFDMINANLGMTVTVGCLQGESPICAGKTVRAWRRAVRQGRPGRHRGRSCSSELPRSVQVRVDQVSVGGVVGAAVGNVMRTLIPQRLWPKIQRRLSFALNRKGIKLPVVCGLELKNTNLGYIGHGIVIDTDIEFDIHSFIQRFSESARFNRRSHNSTF